MIGYTRRRNPLIYVIIGAIAGFLFGSLSFGGTGAYNPVPDILMAHAEGVAYGLYASQNEEDKVAALAMVKEWQKIAEELKSDGRRAKEIYESAQKRDEPLHLSVVLEAFDLQ